MQPESDPLCISTAWSASSLFDAQRGDSSYAICEQRRSRSAYASVQSDQRILCLSTYTIVDIDSVSRQRGP